jgi:hypothetical protein
MVGLTQRWTDRRTEMVELKAAFLQAFVANVPARAMHQCIQSRSSTQPLVQPYSVSGRFRSRNSYRIAGRNRSGLRKTPAVNQTKGHSVNLKLLLSVLRQSCISSTRYTNLRIADYDTLFAEDQVTVTDSEDALQIYIHKLENVTSKYNMA